MLRISIFEAFHKKSKSVFFWWRRQLTESLASDVRFLILVRSADWSLSGVFAQTEAAHMSLLQACLTDAVIRSKLVRVLEQCVSPVCSEVDDHSKCHASQNDITVCKMVDCVACTPVDCVLGHWSEWSPPSCEGLAVRHRNRLQEANACGKPCNGTLVRTKRATTNLECNVKVDCKFTMWSPWTHCGAGITQRIGVGHYPLASPLLNILFVSLSVMQRNVSVNIHVSVIATEIANVITQRNFNVM